MVLARQRGLLSMVGILTFLALSILFVYFSVFSVEVLEIMGYDQVNFVLYLVGITVASAAFFRPLGQMNLGSRYLRWVQAVKTTNIELLILAAVFGAIAFATKDKAISRSFVFSFLGLSWVVLLILNRYLPTLLGYLSFGRENRMQALLIGKPKSVAYLQSWLESKGSVGLEIAGLISPEGAENDGSSPVPVIGRVDDLQRIIAEKEISHIILIDSRGSDDWVRQVARDAYRSGCRIWIYNYWQSFFEQSLVCEVDEGHGFFTFHEEPLDDPLSRLIKRAFDIIVSLPVVIFVLPVLTLLVWAVQRKQSPGPVFFRQRRLGRRQKPFLIYKYRTMHANDESRRREAEQAHKTDDRVFTFGRFLRASSLDELPQFINVLFGEMSVVGPRPHMIQHDDEFARMAEAYKARHFIKPGITGLAQCKGFRGEITDPERLRSRVRYDIEYVSNWSVWLDISILGKTVMQVLRPPSSAY